MVSELRIAAVALLIFVIAIAVAISYITRSFSI